MSKVRVVIQARSNSSRLPKKVLLPIGGQRLCELCFNRAAKCDLDVVVATSNEKSDDELAEYLNSKNIPVFRGSLDDVLARFIAVTDDLDDKDICIRLTADNCFPDGHYIEEIIEIYKKANRQYLAYGNDGNWVPYGLSIEVFSIGSLREADKNTSSDFDREHVTPFVRRQYERPTKPPLPYFSDNLGSLSCTIDTPEDYRKISSLFTNAKDPTAIDWKELVRMLNHNERVRKPEIVLGTVQLGLPYGINKNDKLMSLKSALAVMCLAYDLGINQFDTARVYGKSEARIGEFFSQGGRTNLYIHTKLDPLLNLDQTTNCHEAGKMVRQSVMKSLNALKLAKLPTVMLHRAHHINQCNGAVWAELLALQAEGHINKLGVSIQDPSELQLALSTPQVEHIQMPFNLLDWRYTQYSSQLSQRKDVTVHVRSVFLQGVLLQEHVEKWPQIHQEIAGEYIHILRGLCEELNRESLLDLCIAFARAQSWIDGIVLGADSASQVEQIVNVFTNTPLSWKEINLINESLPRAPENLLNPTLW